jgi:hypothetical protein
MPRHKRHRGGQPGNQNARKHGFYATKMTPEETKKFYEAVNQDNKDPALSALRLKIETAIINDPGNYRILREGSSILIKYLNSKFDFDPQANTLLKSALRNILKASAVGDLNLTEQIVSESLKKAEKLQNE